MSEVLVMGVDSKDACPSSQTILASEGSHPLNPEEEEEQAKQIMLTHMILIDMRDAGEPFSAPSGPHAFKAHRPKRTVPGRLSTKVHALLPCLIDRSSLTGGARARSSASSVLKCGERSELLDRRPANSRPLTAYRLTRGSGCNGTKTAVNRKRNIAGDCPAICA